jgi:hypothetical protein
MGFGDLSTGQLKEQDFVSIAQHPIQILVWRDHLAIVQYVEAFTERII